MRFYREELGWARSDLAGVAGISEQGVEAIEKGKVKSPGAILLKRIAKSLGKSVDELIPEQELGSLPKPGEKLDRPKGRGLRGRDSNPQPTDYLIHGLAAA
ncbi:MAG: hypothetical protein NVSMB32_09220 [Actinomycetota bacterium]